MLLESASFWSLFNIFIGLRSGLWFGLFKSLTLFFLFLSCSLQQCLMYLRLLSCCMTNFLLRFNSHIWNWHFHENLLVFFTFQYTFIWIMTVHNQSCLREIYKQKKNITFSFKHAFGQRLLTPWNKNGHRLSRLAWWKEKKGREREEQQ